MPRTARQMRVDPRDPRKLDDELNEPIPNEDERIKFILGSDPVVNYGFARGTEPVAYVGLILDRFANYRALVPEAPELQQSPPNETRTGTQLER